MPYFRAAVDPSFDVEGRRDYSPNRSSEPTFEENLDRVTRKYVAYFSEKDPTKRAILMRDYKLTERNFSRMLASRRSVLRDSARSAAQPGSGVRGGSAGRVDETQAAARAMLNSRTRPSEGDATARRRGDAAGDRAIPPAPDILGVPSGRRTGRAGRTPTETLDRARRMEDDLPSTRGSTDRRPSRGSGTTPAPPPVDD